MSDLTSPTIDQSERADVLAYLGAMIDERRAKSDVAESGTAALMLDAMVLALAIAHDDITAGKHVQLERAREGAAS